MSAGADGQIMPTVPVHAASPLHSSVHVLDRDPIHRPPSTELPRSASYTYLSTLETEPAVTTIKRTFSDNVLSLPPEVKTKMKDSVQSTNKVLFRRASKKAKKRITSGIFSFASDQEQGQRDDEVRGGRKTERDPIKAEQSRSLSRSVTGTIRTLARKSWAGSRPSSPAPKDGSAPRKKRSWSPSKIKDAATSKPASSRSPSKSPESDAANPVAAKPRRPPLSVIAAKNKSEISLRRLSRNSSSTSLASNDRSRSKISLANLPPLPRNLSSDRLASFQQDVTKRKDPLATVFRNIDSEFITFHAKPSVQKSKVLRTVLLPFLHKYARHPSIISLRAEDLDRRTVILNKWWTALLEMLHGTSNHLISLSDRPAFLESVSMIVSRPEWTVPGFNAVPGDASQPPSIPKSKSTNSLESEDSDFLSDTIKQNVRNMFIQNLLSQLRFVIEKLSWRAAPSSLVTFAGKTCAYAFFYCPGVADMLTRQWNLSAGILGRIFTQYDIHFGDKLALISNGFAANFPPPIRSLSVVSQGTFARYLQPRRQRPQGLEQLDWWHPTWVNRWCGRDTDLFFSFTKHFHILVSEFLSEELSPKERAGIPGLIPVCAQMLVVLEATLYRQANQPRYDDDGGEGSRFDRDHPDSLAPLPVIANADRSIAENRLVILLRDVLGDLDPETAMFRNLFTGSFEAVLKTATRKIPVYSTDPCFVICDFMEEVLPITFRYHQTYGDTPILDWPFWLRVFKQMMRSQSMLTKVRLMAFLYNKWTILISNEMWKRELVLEWLLDQEVFQENFCNWSPMVRHYFYRLLCWRVARVDGAVTTLDIIIFQTFKARLDKCWAHYQYLLMEADSRGLPQPSSEPCTPAPARLLLIVRLDNQPLLVPHRTTYERQQANLGLLNQPSPYQNHSSALNTIPTADVPPQINKKRWSLFRGISMFSQPGNDRPGEVTPPGSPDETSTNSNGTSTGSSNDIVCPTPVSRPITPPHQACSFRFELQHHRALPQLQIQNWTLTPPRLPQTAQNILRVRESSESNANSDSSSEDQKFRPKAKTVEPQKPTASELGNARYSGRALAEWSQVVSECRNFYIRRRQDGVPRDGLVEIPTLGVENFRSPG
ncbi:hypothetical protein PV08_00375 [Exophiala spinifera]|uniref:DUF1765-domain-containing protein n=1 Tax=Exophiala spinifera TaxID=91928 RepID=A0A0D2BMI5_9EURO|nr:uncharacterized protein PV08_00375 [Exophiala spinifera]KIW19800.1 hypothetical protein PV08_00375 [Exophiala spinifera]